MSKVSGTTIVSGVVALLALACATFAGLAVSGHLNSESTPLLTVILSMVATTVTTLLVAIKADNLSHDLRNGLIQGKVDEAFANGAGEHLAPVIHTATTQALTDARVLTRDGPVMNAAMNSLLKILEANGVITKQAQDDIQKEVETDGRSTV